MIKRFCDLCGEELKRWLEPAGGANSARVTAELHRGGHVLKVEVMHTLDGTGNKGDVCTACVIDAVNTADRRERAAAAGTA